MLCNDCLDGSSIMEALRVLVSEHAEYDNLLERLGEVLCSGCIDA